MRTSALFGAKFSDFSKFMVRPHGQGSIFRYFVQSSYAIKTVFLKNISKTLFTFI